MLGGTVDKEFIMVEDVAELAWIFAAVLTNALTGRSRRVNYRWNMS